MLNSYKKISIIYGGSGHKYAAEIERLLQNLHREKRLPVSVGCINTEWVSNNILGDVVNAIRNSDLIYIIFTLDDLGCGKSRFEQYGASALTGRLRQNVLIELGMALVVTDNDSDKIKVIADFSKEALGDDFPSDIRNALSIKEFSDETFGEVLSLISDYVTSSFSAPSTADILHSAHFEADFENVFNEFEVINRYKGKKIKKLGDVTDLWLPALESFDFSDEKLVYACERLVSFPIFGNGTKFIEWLERFKTACRPGKDVPPNKKNVFNVVFDIVDLCMDYTITKTDERTENDTEAYKTLAVRFKNTLKKAEALKADGLTIYPAIDFCLYDYCALNEMKLYMLTEDSSYLEHIIDLFEKAKNACEHSDTGFKLYEGYTTFNLGRAYYYKYCLTGLDEDFEKMEDNMLMTLAIRKKWKDTGDLPECFANALSFEYFYAKSEYLYMLYRLHRIDAEKFGKELDLMINSIDEYINKDSELSKLYVIKKNCLSIRPKDGTEK